MKENPIRYLKRYIVTAFENVNPSVKITHLANIQAGKINKRICYEISDQFKSPYLNLRNRQIVIPELFCSYLWSICYFLFVLNEEMNKDKLLNVPYDGNMSFDIPVRNNALKLFEWALSLQDESTDWPKELPYPNKNTFDEEKKYIEDVNGIFITSLVFILYHEYAHTVLNHDIKNKSNDESIQMETEADNYAREILLNSSFNENPELKSLALLFSYLAILFLQKNYIPTKNINSHPATDERIRLSLAWIEYYLTQDKIQYVYETACVSILIFFQIIRFDICLPIEYDNAKDMFNSILDIFDEYKDGFTLKSD